jgi:hypothetical protein
MSAMAMATMVVVPEQYLLFGQSIVGQRSSLLEALANAGAA